MKTLINALIIILILHFIIKNFEDDSNRYNTRYDLDKDDQEDFQEDMRLKYLMDEEDGFDLHVNNNNDYLQFMETEDDKVTDKYNFNEESESTPNFDTDVTNISKYFQTNYDSIVAKKIGDNNNNKKKEPIEQDSVSKTHCYIDDKDNGCTMSNVKWKYKDEQVQNGGDFIGGVTAFNGIGSEYAVYNTSQLNLQTRVNDVSIPENSNIFAN
jgi:hypothetical protein|tara:strand:- start:52 stop:687 length:636 start_codon:yes stop_codon:yes gene_type:complete